MTKDQEDELGISGMVIEEYEHHKKKLWNYCGGTVSNGTWIIDECGKPSANYSFDPVTMIEGQGTHSVEFPTSVKNIIKGGEKRRGEGGGCHLVSVMGCYSAASGMGVGRV
ncbi:hypothetical protein RUND412_000496 [Rhizina undulata]